MAKPKICRRKKGPILQKSPPPNKHQIVTLSVTSVFRIFGAISKIASKRPETLWKKGFRRNVAKERRGVFGTENAEENLDPDPGEFRPHLGMIFPRSCWTGFSLLQRSVLQREAFLFFLFKGKKGPNSLPTVCTYIHTCMHTYMCVYIYIYTYFFLAYIPDKSMGGTHFGGLRVKQRDAPRLSNGMRFMSHYQKRGYFFSEVPISRRQRDWQSRCTVRN